MRKKNDFMNKYMFVLKLPTETNNSRFPGVGINQTPCEYEKGKVNGRRCGGDDEDVFHQSEVIFAKIAPPPSIGFLHSSVTVYLCVAEKLFKF